MEVKLKTKNTTRKHIYVSCKVHDSLKKLAKKYSRTINCGVADEIVLLGIEAFEETKKN